jgi:DNA-binding NarL/FixJ family response regulator
MINVLFIEDQPAVSEATADKISRNPLVAEIQICNTAEKTLAVLRDEPDRWGLIFLDLDVPGAVGLSLAMEIKNLGKAPITCILTGNPREDYIAQISTAGFQGYMLKAMEISELEKELNRAIAGEQVFPSVGRSNATETPRLTGRQCECLQLVRENKSAKEIAQILSMHPGTVNYHIDSAMDALNVNSRAHAVSIALQFGLLAISPQGGSDGKN